MAKYVVTKSFTVQVEAENKESVEAVKDKIFLDDATKAEYHATQPVETVTVKRFKAKNGHKTVVVEGQQELPGTEE